MMQKRFRHQREYKHLHHLAFISANFTKLKLEYSCIYADIPVCSNPNCMYADTFLREVACLPTSLLCLFIWTYANVWICMYFDISAYSCMYAHIFLFVVHCMYDSIYACPCSCKCADIALLFLWVEDTYIQLQSSNQTDDMLAYMQLHTICHFVIKRNYLCMFTTVIAAMVKIGADVLMISRYHC